MPVMVWWTLLETVMHPRFKAKLRRFLPVTVAVIATVAAIGLAIGPSPRGPYDRSLGVLTATLIAVIWYAYFTYEGVFGRKPTHIDLAMEYDPSGYLKPTIRNLSDNRVRVRIRLSAHWDDTTPVPFDKFYDGGEDVPLEPHGGIGGWIPVSNPGSTTLIVKMEVAWWDDAGQDGKTEPRYWHIDLLDRKMSAVIGEASIARVFGETEKRLGTDTTGQ